MRDERMDFDGERELPLSPDRVWQRLTDPGVLEACIPGCTAMHQIDTDRYECAVRARYGPLKANFVTHLILTDIDAPHRYTLRGRGTGGAAGFGEGAADVELVAIDPGTLLRYRARFDAGGRIALIGSRLFASTTRKLAERFLDAFAAHCHEAARH